MKIKSYQIILFFALLISCTSAYITISGLADIYKNAGYWTVLLIATAIESTRISSIYFISLFWKQLGRFFKYIGCVFITCACLISATGVSGFFFSAFEGTKNQVSTLEISQNTNNALINTLQQQIQSEKENIKSLQVQLDSEVNVYNNLKNNNEDGSLTKQQANSLSRKRSIQNQISASNKEIKRLNEEIIKNTKESSESQKEIVKAAPELVRLRSISSMFGLSSEETLLSILTLLIIFCFDPFGIWLMLFSNKVRGIQYKEPEKIEKPTIVKEEPKPIIKKEPKVKKKKVLKEEIKESNTVEFEPIKPVIAEENKPIEKHKKEKTYKKYIHKPSFKYYFRKDGFK